MSREAIAFLAGSPDRKRLLDHLAEESSSPRDVADALDLSTRSAQRNLSQLVERGWATKREGQYHLTTAGHLVRDTYTNCLADVAAIESFDAFYGHFPDPDTAPDPARLADATCVTAEPDQPQAPVHHYVREIRTLDTDSIRMVSPVLSRLFHEPHAEQVRAGTTTELVLPADRVEAARDKNPLEFETVLAVPRFTLYRYDDDVGYGLTIADDRTFALAYDEDGQLRACVDSTDPNLRVWAVDRFETLRNRSTEVEGPSLPF